MSLGSSAPASPAYAPPRGLAMTRLAADCPGRGVSGQAGDCELGRLRPALTESPAVVTSSLESLLGNPDLCGYGKQLPSSKLSGEATGPMVRQVGWGGNRGRLGRWGDLGPGSVPLLPMPLPPLPPPPCRGPGRGRISIFSLSPAPHARSSPSSVPPLTLGPPCPAMQAPGGSQPPHSALPTPTTQAGPTTTPSSAPPSWGSHSTPPPLAPVTPPPSHRRPQDPPGLRIGPLIPEQDYERLEDCDPEGSQDSPLHGEEQQPLLHVPEGLRGEWGVCGAVKGRAGEGLGAPEDVDWSLR